MQTRLVRALFAALPIHAGALRRFSRWTQVYFFRNQDVPITRTDSPQSAWRVRISLLRFDLRGQGWTLKLSDGVTATPPTYQVCV